LAVEAVFRTASKAETGEEDMFGPPPQVQIEEEEKEAEADKVGESEGVREAEQAQGDVDDGPIAVGG